MTSIVLWVSNIDRQANFYSALLAAPMRDKGDEFCAVGDGTNEVLLHLLPEINRVRSSDLLPAQEEVAIKPVFEIASIDVATDRAAAAEIRILGTITSYGQSSYLDCIDPEGNVIQIKESASL